MASRSLERPPTVIVEEYDRRVLPRPGRPRGVVACPEPGRRAVPENVQQFLVRDLGRVIVDLDRLGVMAQPLGLSSGLG